jgi:hypothetical protein
MKRLKYTRVLNLEVLLSVADQCGGWKGGVKEMTKAKGEEGERQLSAATTTLRFGRDMCERPILTPQQIVQTFTVIDLRPDMPVAG